MYDAFSMNFHVPVHGGFQKRLLWMATAETNLRREQSDDKLMLDYPIDICKKSGNLWHPAS